MHGFLRLSALDHPSSMARVQFHPFTAYTPSSTEGLRALLTAVHEWPRAGTR